MVAESGSRATRQTSIARKEVKVEPRGLTKALTLASERATFLQFLQWDDSTGKAIEVREGPNLERKIEEIAGLLVVRSLFRAIRNLLYENRELLNDKKTNLRALYQQLERCIEGNEVTIDERFFAKPENLPMLVKVVARLEDWLQVYVEDEFEARNVSRRLPTYFTFALNEEWRERRQEYEPLQSELDSTHTRMNGRERRVWRRYREYLVAQVEEPMLLEPFGLKEVFVRPRAYYEHREQRRYGEELSEFDRSRRPQQKHHRIVVDLMEELQQWLNANDKDDAIRALSGEPGSGKSSFCKIFAARLAVVKMPVLFVPLHSFRLEGDFITAVERFAASTGLLPGKLLDPDNPNLRLLLVFDGLDALSVPGKTASAAVQEFVDEVSRQVRRFNQQRTRLQVLFSGRPAAIQAARDRLYKPQQVSYLLPYAVTNARNAYVDDRNLLQTDQRRLWWRKFSKAKGRRYRGLPAALEEKNLAKLTAQPLLNHLVALSLERRQVELTEGTSPNEIYADLLKAVWENGYEQKSGRRLAGSIRYTEFAVILEEIALACWHGNGRTITVAEVEACCNSSRVRKIFGRLQGELELDSRDSIAYLLAASCCRESDRPYGKEKTFEFIHKSFSDYLVARRIANGLRSLHESLVRARDLDEDFDEKDALAKWLAWCGPAPVDEHVFSFLQEEIRIRHERRTAEIADWQQTLCSLIDYAATYGLPTHGLETRPQLDAEVRQGRNAEEALLVVLSATARVTGSVSKIRWGSAEAFGILVSRLQHQRTGAANTLAFDCFDRLGLDNCILYAKDLLGANLSYSSLRFARLNLANLGGANLREANLGGANLSGANLRDAKLAGADLRDANLQDANLDGADLRDANLNGADLSGANLRGANLRDANLRDASLNEADLRSTNLRDTNLKDADLRNADLSRADLRDANLGRANLSRANLSRADLRDADFADTKLSDVNLRGADLSGARLDLRALKQLGNRGDLIV